MADTTPPEGAWMIELPGDPRGVWVREAARASADHAIESHWLPSPDELPRWDTPELLDANYTAMPMWWQRWLIPMIVLFVAAIAGGSTFAVAFDRSPRGVLAVLIVMLSVVSVVAVVIVYAIREVRFRAHRMAMVEECHRMLQHTAIPVWAVLQNRVRVSGGGDTVYDLQFVFDLRVPRETLALQRRVVDAWLDAVAATFGTDHAEHLPEGFASSVPVHAAEVFGEGMHGVWIWDKGAIYPIQVLGLAADDPQTSESFSAVNVVFLRHQPKALRRASKIE